jgi:hypothetical protein
LLSPEDARQHPATLHDAVAVDVPHRQAGTRAANDIGRYDPKRKRGRPCPEGGCTDKTPWSHDPGSPPARYGSARRRRLSQRLTACLAHRSLVKVMRRRLTAWSIKSGTTLIQTTENTHPIANSSVQVKFANGRRADGVWINGLFFHINVLPKSPIAQGRYITNPATK